MITTDDQEGHMIDGVPFFLAEARPSEEGLGSVTDVFAFGSECEQ